MVAHEGLPKRPAYYVRLYRLLHDPAFIAAVAELLRQRDISGFNPGQRPPMNDAKTALVEFSQSEEDAICRALVNRWPVDLITASELDGKLPLFSGPTKPAARYAMDRAGIRKVDRKVRHGGSPETIYAVRSHSKWKSSGPEAIRAEIDRATKDEKTAAMEGDDDG